MAKPPNRHPVPKKGEPPAPPQQRRPATQQAVVGRIVLGLVSFMALSFVLVMVWAGISAARALPHIERAQQVAEGLDPQALLSGDTSQLDELQNELSAARGYMGGPVWSLAEGMPWAGPQFSGARALTETLDDLSTEGFTAVAEVGAGLDALQPQDGQVDVTAVAALDTQIESALSSVTEARSRIATIDPAALVGPLRDGTIRVDSLLAEIEPTLEGTARATSLLPGFLGADGQREHLLLLQNNAEWRSHGGIVGQVIHITATDGHIEFTDQVPGADFTSLDEAVTPLEFDTELIFGDRPARYMQNPTMIPDFAEAAHVARQFWQSEHGGNPSGVIATDPVALSYILEATGPVELATGDVLTSDNVVQLLLNEAYLRYEDPAEQDVFFGLAADAVFDALLSGSAEPGPALQAITRAIEERRLLVWSPEEQERALLEGTPVAGALPVSDEQATTFGVYLNEGGGTKLDYYMTVGSHAVWCGDGTTALRVTLHNDAPEDIYDYPDYLLATFGDAEETASGVPRGITRTLTQVYLPAGAELVGDAENAPLIGQHAGRPVHEWTTDLGPGESATLDMRVRSTTGPQLEVISTPVLNHRDVTPEC
ncbi:DUF4012 domain-containing protein [Nesterenkonia ebinurensis]|uniref:DUF4012 domain-containing protein n=1 Tax=Nesterenkonia ebinurensis TaxID=2608252 RepID=UPI00168B91D4|nr:DUF4012 domain-containing protein [Nesterenkonia ebinurensis]